MSFSKGTVKSFGGTRDVLRSALMAGSISRLGVALVSQCDTEDPGCRGFGVYSSGLPAASAPAMREASTFHDAVSEPGLPRDPYLTASATAAFTVTPEARVMRAAGLEVFLFDGVKENPTDREVGEGVV